MAGARGDALDWALALARAPGERLALRQRPLPEGMNDVLRIAAGHGGEFLAGAVHRSGETEADLVEAVRFYLREVLFHSGADAYRILGLERGASAEKAKAHHRWLQQWLHPDRHTSDWDAIFAGRVNAAWNQLRTEARRRAYDAEHPTEREVATVYATPVMAAWVRDSQSVQSPWQRWQPRVPLLSLMGACAGLGLLALRDVARDEALLVAGSPDSSRFDEARRLADATHNPFGDLHIPQRTSPPATKARPAPAGAVRKQLPVARQPVAKDDAPTGSSLRVLTSVGPLPGAIQAPMPLKPPQVASTRAPVSITAPKLAATSTAAAPPNATRPASGAAPHAPEPALASLPPTQATPSLALASDALAKLPSPVKPSVGEPAAPAQSPVVAAERARQAQQVGDRLLAFMRRPGSSVPPIWDSLSVQQGATQLGAGLRAEGDANFSPAHWRVGEREAHMQVAIHYADGRTGRLEAGLVWREQRWLVRRLSMERDW